MDFYVLGSCSNSIVTISLVSSVLLTLVPLCVMSSV